MTKMKSIDHPVTRDEIGSILKDLKHEFFSHMDELDKKLSERQYEMELRLTRQQWSIYGIAIPLIIAVQSLIMALFRWIG